MAVLNVNNRITMVKNRLPPIVEREGIIVMQNMTSMLMYVNIYSTDKNIDQNFLYNYVTVNLLPEIKRTRGVGQAKILGNRAYAMRIMLDIDRMRAYNVSADDVMKAVADQSMIGSPGRLGQATGQTSQTIEYVLTWVGRYNKPEQYEDIILKANPKGEDPADQGRCQSRAGLFVLRPLLGYRRQSLGRDRAQATPRHQCHRHYRGSQGEARAVQGRDLPSGHGL